MTTENACSRCGWDMDEELAEGFATASTSMHWPKGVPVCGRCLKPEEWNGIVDGGKKE